MPDLVEGGESEWTPESIGQWSKSDKVLRKKAREAQKLATQRAIGAEGDPAVGDAPASE